jgi:hypothetical protein
MTKVDAPLIALPSPIHSIIQRGIGGSSPLYRFTMNSSRPKDVLVASSHPLAAPIQGMFCLSLIARRSKQSLVVRDPLLDGVGAR